MKRTGFSRPQLERQPVPAYRLTRGCAAAVPVASVPIEKFVYVRSPALLKAARRIPCQHCQANDGTVCAAHSNWAEHGKGKSIKASDIFIASLCFRCHSLLDQGREGSRAHRRAMWERAHRRTVLLLNEKGLWPEGVPQP